MFKNIRISTKIALLVLLLTGFAIFAISFFTRDFHRKNIYEKYAATLESLADTRASYVNIQTERIKQALTVLQNADVLKNPGASTSSGNNMMDMFGDEEGKF